MRFLLALSLILSATAGTVQTERWDAATVPAARAMQVARIAERILADRPRYEAVAARSGVPWHVIAGLHNMESGGSFRHHLHEGSPLGGRTRWVPKGRPLDGRPPFRWEDSALDALRYDNMGDFRWSHLHDTLYACERYNGTGYLQFHPAVPTPYLWAGTSIERPGKYVADGKWSSTSRSGQIGIAAIWKALEARGAIRVSDLRR